MHGDISCGCIHGFMTLCRSDHLPKMARGVVFHSFALYLPWSNWKTHVHCWNQGRAGRTSASASASGPKKSDDLRPASFCERRNCSRHWSACIWAARAFAWRIQARQRAGFARVEDLGKILSGLKWNMTCQTKQVTAYTRAPVWGGSSTPLNGGHRF